MRKIYSPIAMFLLCSFWNHVHSQTNSVTLTPPAGPTTNHSSITAAYAAIPNSPTGNYLIEINASYDGSTETFPIILGDKGISGGSPIITIRPAAGNNGEVISRNTPDPAPLVRFDGADNVVLDGRPGGMTSSTANYLTVNQNFSTGTALPAGTIFRNIDLQNSANNNSIQYLNAVSAPATAVAASQNIVIAGSTTTGNTNNKISNNTVSGGGRAIQDFGESASVLNSGTIIEYNVVSGYSGIGIFAGSNQINGTVQFNTLQINGTALFGNSLEGIRQQASSGSNSIIQDNTISITTTSSSIITILGIVNNGLGTQNILRNTITALSGPGVTNGYGLSISANAGTTVNISRNKISGISSGSSAATVNIRGMSIAPTGAAGAVVNVNNNFVSVMQPNTTATLVLGILVNAASSLAYTTNLYHNSVRLGGTHTGGSANNIVSAAIWRNDNVAGSSFNMKNNIAVNERTGGTSGVFHVGFFNGSANGTLDIDYNTYFATDATGGVAAGWGGSVFFPTPAGLTSYKNAATPHEQNSNFANVTFVSATDLHLATPSDRDPALKGTPIAGITVDIDGEARSATEPRQGADDSNLTFPVSLTAFTGENKGRFNRLTWITATESNNAGFELQRSNDGRVFSTFAAVKSKGDNGNSATALTYSYDDLKPYAAASYYRLKQTDLNGNISYSDVVLIKGIGVHKLQISNLYPNPVKDKLQVVVGSSSEARLVVMVYDISGKVISQQVNAVKAGDNFIHVNTASLTTGTYILTIRDMISGEVSSSRFVK